MKHPTKDTPQHTKVIYLPYHAHGDVAHPDCETGFVSSCNESGVFVKFARYLELHGWEGTTSQHCYFESLIIEGDRK